MILGFLGKGGSGKSSVATQTALWFQKNNASVLAIDADHNMDLAYNLFDGSLPSDMSYFGTGLSLFASHVGLDESQKYDVAFLQGVTQGFSFDDSVTRSLSSSSQNDIKIMAAGPQTDKVLYGESCSHSLTTPLKLYLPLLNLEEGEYVVVDEKAGADGVSSGIVTGIDVGVIVCEPALHSVKTALQIAELMDFYDTPYVFVGNKIQSEEDKEFIIEQLGQEPSAFFSEVASIKRNPGAFVEDWGQDIAKIISRAKLQSQNNRLERTIKKFERNHLFQNQ